MKSKPIKHLYHQFGGLVYSMPLSSQDIARILSRDGLIQIEGDRYIETNKMKSIQVLSEYVELLLKEEM